ncbi:MAG TPA: tail fiber protein [Croceibacterium sp.]|jgi:microcystin-dependent protein
MSSPFVAEIRCFGFNFAPKGWAFCDGQLLPISQNTALFSLVGTFYGGDGKSVFALPNLQGAVATCQGQSSTGTQWFVGEEQGETSVTLLTTEIPVHGHTMSATTVTATGATAAGGQLAKAFKGNLQSSNKGDIYSTAAPNQAMSPQALALSGGSLPHNNMMPYLTLNFCIALQGVFPPRP